MFPEFSSATFDYYATLITCHFLLKQVLIDSSFRLILMQLSFSLDVFSDSGSFLAGLALFDHVGQTFPTDNGPRHSRNQFNHGGVQLPWVYTYINDHQSTSEEKLWHGIPSKIFTSQPTHNVQDSIKSKEVMQWKDSPLLKRRMNKLAEEKPELEKVEVKPLVA